jgi:hypothetical protein
VLAVIRICQIFQQYKAQIQFRFTLTSANNVVLHEWEPGAPPFEERLKALIYAFNDDFKTSISCEPALDDITGIHQLYDITIPYVTESFWIGTMNHCRGPVQLDPVEVYNAFKGLPLVRFKDSISNVVSSIQTENKTTG